MSKSRLLRTLSKPLSVFIMILLLILSPHMVQAQSEDCPVEGMEKLSLLNPNLLLPESSLKNSAPSCARSIQLYLKDLGYTNLGLHEFPEDTTIAEVKETIKSSWMKKAKFKQFPPNLNLYVFQKYSNCRPLADFMTLKEAGYNNGDTLRFKVDQKKVDNLVENVYDQDVLPVLSRHLKEIELISEDDQSSIVMIGLASHIKSDDYNQQFPLELQQIVAREKKGITIMLIDQAFNDEMSDFKQIYAKGALGKTQWKQVENLAKGKVRIFVNEKEFGARVTIRVYATNVLEREWSPSPPIKPTLAGTISLEDLERRLSLLNKKFIVGDFHRTSERPDILGTFY